MQDSLSCESQGMYLGVIGVFIFSPTLPFWYKGLALEGIARVGQVQLLQPFLILTGAALLLDEALDATTFLFGAAAIVVVAIGRNIAIRR